MFFSRRTIAQVATWETAADLVTDTAPTTAVLVSTCPRLPVGGWLKPHRLGGWKWVPNSPGDTAITAPIVLSSTETTLNMWAESIDLAVNQHAARVTATSNPIAVTAGCTYPVVLTVQTQRGVGGTPFGGPGRPSDHSFVTHNTDLVVNIGEQQLFSLSSQPVGGGTLVQFPGEDVEVSRGVLGGHSFGANGVRERSRTFTADYAAASTGPIVIALTFTLWGTGSDGNYDINDDYRGVISLGARSW